MIKVDTDFRKILITRLIVKVVLPLFLSLFFLYFVMVDNNSSNNYQFKPEDIGNNIIVIGIEDFKTSIDTKKDSIIFLCSNNNQKCYNMLLNLKNTNMNIRYLNILELTDKEKDEIKNYEIFKDGLYPKLIVIKNNSIKYYSNYLNKEELNKIL